MTDTQPITHPVSVELDDVTYHMLHEMAGLAGGMGLTAYIKYVLAKHILENIDDPTD